MWVILGPFDGEVVGDVAFQKAKLLKPNTSYTVGRKDRPLLINNKKISHDHCQFIVGNHTTDDVGDPTVRPSLQIFHTNKKEKGLRITKPDEEEGVAPANSNTSLEHADRVSLISGVVLQVEWRPICAYYSPSRGKASITLDACASLGIKIVNKVQENITHHLATHYVANLEMTTSLLTLCRIVKPEWLMEVVRLGNLPRGNEQPNGTSLEDHFVLPQETKYHPSFSPSLMPSQKAFDIWEPNEERVNFFGPLRFICLHEKVTQMDSEVREAIHRGGGILETFDIHSGVPKFHKALTRSQAKSGKQTVVVGDTDAMRTAIGTEDWAKLVSEARSFGLDIFPPSKMVQSVLDVNLLLLQSSAMEVENEARNSSPLPEVVLNSIPDEPSVQPDISNQTTAPRRKLVRRAQSRETSVPPALSEPPPNQEASSRPRRLLTRRVAGGQPVVTGLDDPSAILDGIPDLRKTPPPQPPAASLTGPTPARTSKLKRRVGVGGPGALVLDSQMSGIGETMGEPPLKKFKALFEASNPGGPEPDSLDLVESTDHSQSQTQTETQARSDRLFRSMGASSLAIMREEEEETQSGHAETSQQRRPKRTLDSVDEDDEMEIDGILAPSNGSEPATKKRAVENVNAVDKAITATGGLVTAHGAASKPPSTVAPAKDKQAGAPPGKPDTDAAFLKAIASTKRGKKTEDAFDREFNKLKISKPEIEEKDPEEEWAVLADFGDDSGLRGNFMVVVEMEPYKKDSSGQRKTLPNHSWDGKTDFKKFKKKVMGVSRTTVELFLSEENDYGMGAAYWKGGHSQAGGTQTQTFMESQVESQAPAQSQRPGSRKPKTQPLPDTDDDEPVVLRKSRQPPSRSETKAPANKRSAAKSKPPAKATALFLDSDYDDIQEVVEDNSRDQPTKTRTQVDEEQTLESSAETKAPVGRRSTRTAKAPKKPSPIIVDDDSDDGAVFKGFKGRKGGR